MLSLAAYLIPLAAFVVVVCLAASVRILRECERAVVFTLGRFQSASTNSTRCCQSARS